MKVLHVPFTFAPDPVGGTEVYVEALARELRLYDIESIIAAPSSNGKDEVYKHNDLQVYRYRWAPESKHMLRELYGGGDPETVRAFVQILDAELPDIVHVHAFTREISILLVRAAKQRNIPVVFTYHVSTVSCQRGNLMLWGREVCDGVLDVRRCTDCSLEDGGLPRWVSMPLSYVPSLFAMALEKANLSGSLWTALRMAELIRARCDAFQALTQEVDSIVALREWIRQLLLRNGVPMEKIVLSPHGLVDGRVDAGPLVDIGMAPLRVAYFGRMNQGKGIDTLIRAVKAAPELPIELHVYGIAQSSADRVYQIMLESLSAADSRIRFFPPVAHERIVPLLAGYHLLAVPSHWMETGPLVVLESFAAGTPVLGSNLGGIAELVRHEKNGLLVQFDDVQGWTDALKRCATDRELLGRLRDGVEQPRGMADVAQDMVGMYRRLVHRLPSDQRNGHDGLTTEPGAAAYNCGSALSTFRN